MKQSQEIMHLWELSGPEGSTPPPPQHKQVRLCIYIVLGRFLHHFRLTEMGREDFTSPHPSRSPWAPTEAFPPVRDGQRVFLQNQPLSWMSPPELFSWNKRIPLPLVPFASSVLWFSLGLLFWREWNAVRGDTCALPLFLSIETVVPKELQFPEEISFQGEKWMMLGTNQRSLPLKKRAVIP